MQVIGNFTHLKDAYQRMSEEASTQGIQKSPQELYWEASGGRDRKGRVRGLGQGAELYYGSQSRGPASSQYTPVDT